MGDSIRIIMLEEFEKILSIIAKDFTPQGQKLLLVPMLKKLFSDRSWKVRAIGSHMLPSIVTILKNEEFEEFATTKFVEYLDDIETEVKVRATFNISNFVECLDESKRKDFIINELIAKIELLINSNNTYIKVSLSKSIIKLSKYLTQAEITKHLLNYFMTLLRDSNSNISLVTINQICEQEASFSMSELSSSIFDSISELIKDNKWRIREQVVKMVPSLLKSIGYETEECTLLLKTCLSMLTDSIHAVRKVVVESIRQMVQQQGLAWTQAQIIPYVLELQNSPNHLHRQIFVDCLAAIVEFMPPDQIVEIHDQTKTIYNDSVPNMRFRLIQFWDSCFYSKLAEIDSPKAKAALEEILAQLQIYREDKDYDVKDFAENFLEKIGKNK